MMKDNLAPSVDAWLKEAKADPAAKDCGMFLVHNGTVRQTAKAKVRQGVEGTAEVCGMRFSYDAGKVDAAVQAAKPATVKGVFIKSMSVSSTMGIGVPVQVVGDAE